MARNFSQRLQGLLGDPTFNLGIGLLAASGPSPAPRSLGQVVAQGAQFASERQRNKLQNDLLRQEMQQRARRNQASQQLSGLLSSSTVAQAPGSQVQGVNGLLGTIPGRQGLIPTAQTPQGQREMLGLLGQIAPESVAESMLSTGTAREFSSPIGKLIGDLELAEQSGNEFAQNQIRSAIEQELGDDVELSEIRSFRNDVIRNSEGFLVAQQGLNRVLTGAKAGTAAGDLAVTFGIMKILDPTSVVREGEQATVRNAGGVPERIRNMYNNIITGETLTPEQRQDFVNQAQAQFAETVRQQKRVINDAREFSARNDLPVEDVVPEFVLPIADQLSSVEIPEPEAQPRRTLQNPLTPQEQEELRRLRQSFGIE